MLVYTCTEVARCCVQENFKKHGLRALDLTSEFEERLVLETNRVYLCNTLEVRNRSPCALLLSCLCCLLSGSLLSLFLHCYSGCFCSYSDCPCSYSDGPCSYCDCPCSYNDGPCSYVHVLAVTVHVLAVTVLLLTVTVLVLTVHVYRHGNCWLRTIQLCCQLLRSVHKECVVVPSTPTYTLTPIQAHPLTH